MNIIKLVDLMAGVDVRVIDGDTAQVIYEGDVLGIKRNKQTFKKYEVSTMFKCHDNADIDLEIYAWKETK